MAFKINKYSKTNVAELNHGEWLIGLTDNYIKEVAHKELGVEITDDQCLEAVEWIEDNLFDIILNACEDLGFEYDEEDE